VVARFGAALAWAWQSKVTELHVLVEESAPGDAGVVARRAKEMATPPAVWSVDGRAVVPASPSGAGPMEEPADGETADLLRAHGIEPVLEHGVLRGEVLGLEVARVVSGNLEVGVGRFDRLARAEMRGSEDLDAALDEAAGAVRAWRVAGAPRHPANTLARGRWLRSIACARPDLVGAKRLVAVPPPLPWFDLTEAGSAPCLGLSLDDRPLVVVCSVGVDMDLIPTASDCRLLHCPEAELVLALPEGDDVLVTRELAGSLARPAAICVVPRTWEGLVA
jgi:hypothetical protein